jgi:glycosyltransferase involved in cell wall biosynthesis
MSNSYFSIVTPVFNRPQYLEQTIKSFLSQQFKNYEYIIVDGGSKEKTLKIINKYKSKIHLISEKDKGMYDALYKGFSIASGKYFMWLNSDDFFLDKQSLLRLYNHLHKYNDKWITGKISITKNQSNKVKTYFPLMYPQFIIKNGMANNCFWGFIQQENTVFSKQLYKKVGGLNRDFKMAGDFDLWKRFAKYEKLISVPIAIAVHRKWIGQLTNLDYYYSEINKKKCLFNLFYFLRFLLSIIFILKSFFSRIVKCSQKETNS